MVSLTHYLLIRILMAFRHTLFLILQRLGFGFALLELGELGDGLPCVLEKHLRLLLHLRPFLLRIRLPQRQIPIRHDKTIFVTKPPPQFSINSKKKIDQKARNFEQNLKP